MEAALASGITTDNVLDSLRERLGNESRAKMEELLKEGFSQDQVLRMMVEVGKTEDEEQEELRRQIHNFENDPSVSTEDKLALVKSHLNEEAKALMEELLRQGYSKEEVMDLFLRCANNIDMITSDALFQRKVRFSDEPPDAYLYE